MPIIKYTQPDSLVRNGRPTIFSPVMLTTPSGVGNQYYDGWAETITGASGVPTMTNIDGRYHIDPSGWNS